MLFKTRDLFVSQRTQIVNALRGHMAEFGWVAPTADTMQAISTRSSQIRRANDSPLPSRC